MSNLIAIKITFKSNLSDKEILTKIRKNEKISIYPTLDIENLNLNIISDLLYYSTDVMHDRIIFLNFNNPSEIYKLYIKIITILKDFIDFDFDNYLKVYFKHSNPNDIKYLRLNKIKFVLDFDEQKLYNKFPLTRVSPFTQHINTIKYLDFNNISNDIINIENQNYYFNNTIYNLIDFTHCDINRIILNFAIGRECYQLKDVIQYIELTDKLITSTCNDIAYTDNDKKKISRIYKLNRNIYDTLNTYKGFKERYSNLKLLYNLVDISDSTYELIKENLIDIIILGNINNGTINYDSNIGMFELNGANIKFGELNDLHLFNCNIQYGNIRRSFAYECNIDGTILYDSKLKENEIKNSILENNYLTDNNKLTNCYIYGKLSICNANLKNCTINGGILKSKDTDNIKINNLN